MRTKIFQPIILLLALIVATALSTSAQTSPANRWLIVVDTSFSMARRADAVQVAVQNLYSSGMSGQLRRGDTIGLWTFNENLYTGRFPLQVWLPEARQAIAKQTGQFLKQQRYEKTTHYDEVIPAINNLVAKSDVLTVILLTDGDKKIQGTPFDAVINASFKQDFNAQKKAGTPFIVALRAQGGKLVDYTVTLAPWPAKFPSLPVEPEIVKQVEPAPIVVTLTPAPTPVVPSLIVSGNKSEPAVQPEPVAPPVEKPATVTLNPEPVVSLTPTATIETKNVASVAVNPPVIPEPQTKVDIAPQPAPTPPVAPRVVPVKLVIEPPVQPAPKTEAKVEIAATKVNVLVVSPADSAPKPVTVQIADPSPIQEPQADAAASKSEPVEVAVVAPPATNSGNQKTLLIGLGLLIAALAIGIYWLRRPRHASQASLITRSLDKDKK